MHHNIVILVLAAVAALSACDSELGVRDEETPVLPEQASPTPGRVGAAYNAEQEVQPATTAARAVPDVCGAPLDTNRNGVVELAEYNSFSGFSFDEWNQDGNEELTAAEFHSCWRALGWGNSEPAFAAFDDDNDGILTSEEFFGRDEFQLWDKNSDSALSPEERL